MEICLLLSSVKRLWKNAVMDAIHGTALEARVAGLLSVSLQISKRAIESLWMTKLLMAHGVECI
jgi:hypothetical protein